MTGAQWDAHEEWKLADYLVSRVERRATGRAEAECRANYPRDVYFVGNMRPREDADEGLGQEPELITKLSPVALGAEFVVRPTGTRTEVRIEAWWACYYRVFPTYKEQCAHQQHAAESEVATADADEPTTSPIAGDGDDSADTSADSPDAAQPPHDRRRGREPKDSLYPRFRKINCRAQGRITVTRGDSGNLVTDTSDVQRALDAEMARAQAAALADPERVREQAPGREIKIPEGVLQSEATYRAFLDTLTGDVTPAWAWSVDARATPHGSDMILWMEYVNTSPVQRPVDREWGYGANVEPFLFDTRLAIAIAGGEVLPFELDLAPRGFRYNRDLWGRGFNCAVQRRAAEANTFVTTHLPVYEQQRYVTAMEPPARFADLAAEDPLPALRGIYRAMEAYLDEWEAARARYAAAPGWEAQFGDAFAQDRTIFEDEIARFKQGCQLIAGDMDVGLAFRLTNETFRHLGEETGKAAWRLFQLVFLVSQIPGISALRDPSSRDTSEREIVDIVYFPTGGGKTEAYLAVITFHCFLDRLRGKMGGVTAWTRFPLRLLTLQQTQRVADVIGIAELVRRGHPDPRLSGPAADGFAVGYYVGQGGSPNELYDVTRSAYANAADQTNWSQANDPEARQAWKRVTTCPSCRTASIHVDFDVARVRVIHRCANPDCVFPGGELPVYVVDNEIYRYLPSVLVGTIDKLATLGSQRKFALLLGRIDGRCSVHGYYRKQCCQKDCAGGNRLRPDPPRGVTGPTLFVQDELHLLKEGLGTFDAHYETFVQTLQQVTQGAPLKIIASSATIEAFERQVAHLYGRMPAQARVFPGPGPTLARSFYAETRDYPQRLFVGILPHNKTIFNAMLELLEMYHREIALLRRIPQGDLNPYGGHLMPGTTAWAALLDAYATSLTYFLNGRDLSALNTDINGHVNPSLEREGVPDIKVLELTGNTTTDEVARILARLERPAIERMNADAVLATSMVSHGVDIARLNAMFFYGMPRQIAEYIQASSRVGRTRVGIVFMCFHPARERDRSHYTYFSKFHEFLGQMVEPAAINRWAKFGIDRTLPGLFMGTLLQVMADRATGVNPNRYYGTNFVRQQIASGSLRREEFVDLLDRAYFMGADAPPGTEEFHTIIRSKVDRFFDRIVGAGATTQWVSDALRPDPPMRSLRDVDEAIEIELDRAGTRWAGRTARGGGEDA